MLATPKSQLLGTFKCRACANDPTLIPHVLLNSTVANEACSRNNQETVVDAERPKFSPSYNQSKDQECHCYDGTSVSPVRIAVLSTSRTPRLFSNVVHIAQVAPFAEKKTMEKAGGIRTCTKRSGEVLARSKCFHESQCSSITYNLTQARSRHCDANLCCS
jgi:hypothetical protein